MGAVQKLLKQAENKEEVTIRRLTKTKGKNPSGEELLEDEDEIIRLSQYIDPKEKAKITDLKSAIKHGIEKIGTYRDTNRVLPDLIEGARKKYKEIGAKFLLKNIIKHKIEQFKENFISKNIFLKKVSYKRGEKTIEYLQGRNAKTGRIVKSSTVKRLITIKSRRG